MNSSLNDEEKNFLRPISNPVPNHESDEMAVQSNGEASRQQLRYPISATNKNPQHPSDSPIVRAQLAFQQSAGSSTAGATNSQHKKWIKTQESGHASCNGNWRQQNVSSRASDVSSTRSVHEAKPVMMQDGSGAKRQQMTTGSTTNAGCRPKSGNWRNHNFNSRAFDASSTKRPAQEAEPVMQYAGGAKPRLQHFIKEEQYPQKDRKRENEKERNSKWHKGNNKQPFKHFPLNFTEVLKMITDNDPGLVVQKFAEESTGLGQFLKSNPANWEIVELILAVIGNFCFNKGPVLFHNAFIKIVQILGDNAVFKNLESVILNIPKSRSSNLGSKEERLTRLIRSISYLTTEMMTVMPALTCDYLGERFFEDVCALQTMPSFRDFNVNDAFDSLEKEGADRLKNAWEQHSKAIKSKCDGNQRELIRIQRQELMIHLKPPDDFRELSVMPEWEDVCTDAEPFLRPSLIKGTYPDVDTYLDIQFRLLREDFLNPLREGLVAFREKIEKQKKQQIRVDNIRLYYDVKIEDDDDSSVSGSSYILDFSTKGFQRVNWEGSKRLLFGSLLLLSADNFNSFMLFTVVDRKPEQLSLGRIKAKFEGESLPTYAKKTNFVMAESSVFFEAYRSVLIALQRISPAHFPMEDYILCRNVLPTEPEYLKKTPDPIYNLTSVRKTFSRSLPGGNANKENEDDVKVNKELQLNPERLLSHVSILGQSLPDAETLELDPSQAEALYAALTRKLVLIQGPPGTGKTYLGLKIVQALLDNRKYWVGVKKHQPPPILVICYTNHALDQFLEGILKFTTKIVRIGGQSKCEALQPYSLREWIFSRNRFSFTSEERTAQYHNWLWEARDKLRDTKDVLESRRQEQKIVESSGIVHEKTLSSLGVLSKSVYSKFFAMTKMKSSNYSGWLLSCWLGLESIHILKDIVWTLKKHFPKSQKPTMKVFTKPVPVVNESHNEEEWDKEDVEEIQGERMSGDDNLWNFADAKGEKLPKPELERKMAGFQFAISTSMLDDEMSYLLEILDEPDYGDFEPAQSRIAQIQQQKHFLSEILEILPDTEIDDYKQMIEKDLWRLSYVDRWKIYSYWRARTSEILVAEVNSLKMQLLQQTNEIKDIETIETAEIIRNAHVVGITTTGAAKNRALLEHLKSKIVVVEEAAEVLEAHIVTSLSSSCEHLILIGDHQQLRPPTTVYALAKDYHLDVSLFERLIMNGVEPSVLGVQHRMRPDVARLIVPAIYPNLENHQSVTRYWNVPGMAENVFFLSHSEREKGDLSDQESRSHLNPYEADMALALARHLLMQGLEPKQITILTTYSGQLLHFKKLRKSHAILQDVRISIVDNFQGEEADIIILSLVRSNDEAQIGFLKTENRVCVALSRAKKGFYLIGNMGNLAASSKLWREVNKVLTSNGQIGPYFDLRCGVHRTIIKANQVSDFPPEGGCFQKCLTPMPCGHTCRKLCHFEDREHTRQNCLEACLRSCSVGHRCPKRCYEDCHPCLTEIPKTLLPCNHTQITECHKDPRKEYCLTKVVKAFQTCQHTIELDCGKKIYEVKCPELCGMHLDCDHMCNRICHQRKSHAKLPCTQPCRRLTCPEKHPCPKQCSEKCEKCVVDVIKKLPCGHDGEIKCWQLPKDIYCKIKVERTLSACEHTAFFDCSQSTDGYKCTHQCGKLLCNDGHICRKPCCEPCGPCNNQVKRTLSCGHERLTACYKDPLTIKCKFPKEVILPDCGHKVEIACADNPETALCPRPCDTRLNCGHQCTESCHVKNDPHHEIYLCKKACSRNKEDCKRDHKCGRKCYEECDPCIIKIERQLPCGHSQVAECCLNDEEINCREMVNKTIPECMHSIRVECSTIASRQLCKQPCEQVLSCGHPCKKKCVETCSSSDCQELVQTTVLSPCGHPVLKTCSDFNSSPEVTETQLEKFLQECPQKCDVNLPCEHSCKGSCGQCFNCRLHKACQEKCGRTLVCGHNCGVNCAASCPPCKKPCEYRCRHSRCRKNCCEPCVDCVEPCGWKCEHYSCSLKCFEFCIRPRCDEPCRKRLPCGHLCVGLCGEVCPPLCRVCHKDQLTEFILYGNEEEDDARFIYLEDCKHTIEVEGMDHWMEMKEEETREIQMKCCPRCKTIIRSCYRYGNVIKRNFGDIVEVKRLLLRSRTSSKDFAEKHLKQIVASIAVNRELTTQLDHSITDLIIFRLEEIRNSLIPTVVRKKPQYRSLDEDTRSVIQVQVDVIERVLSVVKKAPASSSKDNQVPVLSMSRPLLEDLLNRTQQLLSSLFNRKRFSSQEHECFIAEVYRLKLIRAFFLLKSSIYNQDSLISEENRQVEELLMKNVKPLKDEEIATIKDILQRMDKKLKTGLGISDVEREQIVEALKNGKDKITQGHWFKCPNGHIYAIGECGGAMQEAKCNECGAPIGGGNHRLLSGNRHAGEMDGARFAAYSEEANNMANFQMDD